MTKDDLKTLAQLPKVLVVLRKLAAEGAEVARLMAQVSVPLGAPTHEVISKTEVMSIGTPRGMEPYQATRTDFHPPIPVQGPLPDFGPKEELPHLIAKKREREAFLKDKRNSPERQDKLKQFAHDGEPKDDSDELAAEA